MAVSGQKMPVASNANPMPRKQALLELEAAEFFGLEDGNAAQMTSTAYDTLHEIPLAVEHYEKFLTLARGQGLNPQRVQGVAEHLQQLKATLTPVFVNATEPKAWPLVPRLVKLKPDIFRSNFSTFGPKSPYHVT